MKSRHSPCPWEVASSAATGKKTIVHHHGASVATAWGLNAQNAEANARLISAAPDLLAALELVLSMIAPGAPDDNGNVYGISVLDSECERRMQVASEAIAKARGQS